MKDKLTNELIIELIGVTSIYDNIIKNRFRCVQ